MCRHAIPTRQRSCSLPSPSTTCGSLNASGAAESSLYAQTCNRECTDSNNSVQSFILVILPYTLLLPPLILLLILRPLSFGHVNYLPAGPTPLLFALLAQFHSAVPITYRYRVGVTSSPQPVANTTSQLNALLNSTVTLSSKTMSYFIPIQLALSQFPSSLLPAAVGWAVGYAYRNEAIPGAAWRIPAWVVGQKSKGPNMETLRRRLEGEETDAAHATAADLARDGEEGIRGRFTRLFGEQFLDRRVR
jgi:hypothetical protein